ncbi:MAG: NADH-quinone oxidoreductase subunit NuoH [Chloroflexi bacterium]|nr:NADH-quinone oxidoreductase subunit NuoH [Chloroflexota bacterium]
MVLSEFAGISMPDWIDAIIRVMFIVALMTIIAFALIYLERKILARLQARVGPTRTGPIGTLQSIADALKLVTKEDVRPITADRWAFELAPYMAFVPVFLVFVPMPFTETWFIRDLNLGLLFVFGVLGLNIVGVVMAAWGSDNKYALLGGVRAAAQAISYEIPMLLIIVAVVMVAASRLAIDGDASAAGSINAIVGDQTTTPYLLLQPLGFAIFLIGMLAELHRPPFDMPIAESEVVGGYFVEYSGMRWGMFFLAEYTALFLLVVLASSLFLGGWNWPFGADVGLGLQIVLTFVKTSVMIVLVIGSRALFPRLRIDQLMAFSWKVLLPFAIVQVLANGIILAYGGADWVVGLVSFALLVALGGLVYYLMNQKKGAGTRTVQTTPATPRVITAPEVTPVEAGGD